MSRDRAKGTLLVTKEPSPREEINAAVSGFIWGVPAMICIIGIGLLLTIQTRCIQVRKFTVAMKNTIGKIFDKKKAKGWYHLRK